MATMTEFGTPVYDHTIIMIYKRVASRAGPAATLAHQKEEEKTIRGKGMIYECEELQGPSRKTTRTPHTVRAYMPDIVTAVQLLLGIS